MGSTRAPCIAGPRGPSRADGLDPGTVYLKGRINRLFSLLLVEKNKSVLNFVDFGGSRRPRRSKSAFQQVGQPGSWVCPDPGYARFPGIPGYALVPGILGSRYTRFLDICGSSVYPDIPGSQEHPFKPVCGQTYLGLTYGHKAWSVPWGWGGSGRRYIGVPGKRAPGMTRWCMRNRGYPGPVRGAPGITVFLEPGPDSLGYTREPGSPGP